MYLLPRQRQLGHQLPGRIRRAKLAEVTVDGRTGEVIEAWQGTQAAWVMARGHAGYFGDTFESWYIWLPLCRCSVAPFFDPRRPFRMLHLDLLVLVGGFGVSHFFFNRGEIGTAVPLVYPVLAYLLGRMLVAGFRPRLGRAAGPVRAGGRPGGGHRPAGGFRIGLDLTERQGGRRGLRERGRRRPHPAGRAAVRGLRRGTTSTSTPTGPSTTWPTTLFVRVLEAQPPSSSSHPEDYDLPGGPAAAIVFDLLTLMGLFLLGCSSAAGRAGRLLGLALAYGWVELPYTLFPLMSNTNDTLISALVVFALLGLASSGARGALIALAGAAKFAPLALAPLFASGRGEAHGCARGSGSG